VQSRLGSRLSASCCPGATFSMAKLLRPLLMLRVLSWLARWPPARRCDRGLSDCLAAVPPASDLDSYLRHNLLSSI
jgi:hypothetical protein